MPVKRRAAKRRVDVEREYEVWSAIFGDGYDFFDELPEFGLLSAGHGRVSLELAREPWQRFGARWLAEHGQERRLHPIWALSEFGQP
ncbi:hypothetical protein [Parafrankia sp. BMG5.11]|uniref:hypothetical protein n=1 Tax=Parafrankia sp. BMG5.11 TaxID=222540 RepID=UPI0010402383|nr:hypothetical protein [Parafrankia sp. BMG5.11]TCJ39205.1 hypothetical protein E0504_08630 [Parafrankia sp. BMG5.11]